MKKIFIILEEDNDYESKPYPIGFVESEDSAKQMCERLDFLQQSSIKLSDDVLENTRHIWAEDLGLESMSDFPRWPAGLAGSNITAEMRSERDKIKLENGLIQDRNREKSRVQEEKIIQAVSEFITQSDLTDELRAYSKNKIDKKGYMRTLRPYRYESVDKLD